MKEKLSKFQSQQLLGLGISPRFASDEEIEDIYQQEYNEPRPKIFTYFDLRKLLPPEIEWEGQRYPLTITYGCDVPTQPHNLWFAYYDDLFLLDDDDGEAEIFPNAPEEIDALFELFILLVEKELINIEEINGKKF